MNKLLLSSSTGGNAFIILGVILTIVVFALAVWLIGIGQRNENVKLKLRPKYIFLIVLFAGAVIRIIVAFSMRGLVGNNSEMAATRTGYTGIYQMVYSLINDGLTGFWESYASALYYPITMYILAFFGSVGALFFPMELSSVPTMIFLKLPFVISDILLAYVVYKIAEKYAGELTALALGGLVAICPVFMLGAIWPSYLTFFALALAIMIYFMLERSYIKLIVTYTVSVLLCFEAIFLLPAVAVYLIYAYVRMWKSSKAQADVDASAHSMLIKLPIATLACIIGAYLITLPFALGSVGANPFAMLYILYLRPFDKFAYFTYNGLSLYNIFNKNGVELTLAFPTFVFSLLFIAAIIAVTVIIYLSKKNRASLVMFISYLLFTINVYFVNSSEITLLPALLALLLGYAVLKDKRLLQVFGIAALIVFINAVSVFIKADYFTAVAAAGEELLNGGWTAVSIVCSCLAVICHIYFTVVLLDVVMNGRLKKMNVPNNKFSSSLKGLIKIKD